MRLRGIAKISTGRLQWLAVISVFIARLDIGKRIARQFLDGIWWGAQVPLHKLRINMRRFWRRLPPSFWRTISTFCVEAAVLIMLFPPLDFWIEIVREGSSSTKGAPPIDMHIVIRWSATLGLGFLAASIIADMFSERGADRH
jgi:hypothetical protein